MKRFVKRLLLAVFSVTAMLVFCAGCTTYEAIKHADERNGPGVESPAFRTALDDIGKDDPPVIAKLANWHGNSYGYDDIQINDAAGVLAITEEDVIFFAWGAEKYVPVKTITRSELGEVVVAAKGASRRLILVTGEEHNTFEIIKEGRWFVDVEGTELVATILRQHRLSANVSF